jgi:hypothetical protein
VENKGKRRGSATEAGDSGGDMQASEFDPDATHSLAKTSNFGVFSIEGEDRHGPFTCTRHHH